MSRAYHDVAPPERGKGCRVKTREELKLEILKLERMLIGAHVEEECPWCGATNVIMGTPLKHYDDCLWIELKNEAVA